MFINEMIIFVKMNHSNVVSFLGACVEPPNLAIVMEMMDMSLFDAIHIKSVGFSANNKLDILKGTTKGMAYLHQEDIAHCDLKSQDVLLINVPDEPLTDDSLPVLAKITDFGLSKMKSDVTTSNSVAVAGFTPRYAAPEIHRGELLNLNQQKMVDMFSLGLLIWELAKEEIPLEDLTFPQLRVNIGEKGLTPDASNLNTQLQGLLHSCWKMKPESRPSADDMAEKARTATNLFNEDEE